MSGCKLQVEPKCILINKKKKKELFNGRSHESYIPVALT